MIFAAVLTLCLFGQCIDLKIDGEEPPIWETSHECINGITAVVDHLKMQVFPKAPPAMVSHEIKCEPMPFRDL